MEQVDNSNISYNHPPVSSSSISSPCTGQRPFVWNLSAQFLHQWVGLERRSVTPRSEDLNELHWSYKQGLLGPGPPHEQVAMIDSYKSATKFTSSNRRPYTRDPHRGVPHSLVPEALVTHQLAVHSCTAPHDGCTSLYMKHHRLLSYIVL